MKIKIRDIISNDYPKVASLYNNELGVKHVNSENIASVMRQMHINKDYKTFVALSDNEVVGFITTVITLSIGFEVGYLKINGIAVNRNFQNKGIGHKLIEHAENYARNLGLSSMILNSGFQRSDAHNFYEHSGFESTSYCFVKTLKELK